MAYSKYTTYLKYIIFSGKLEINFTRFILQAINQNGGFTRVWVSLKTIFFPIVICVLAWYWRRVNMLSRSPALLEYLLLALGAALTFLNSKPCIIYPHYTTNLLLPFKRNLL